MRALLFVSWAHQPLASEHLQLRVLLLYTRVVAKSLSALGKVLSRREEGSLCLVKLLQEAITHLITHMIQTRQSVHYSISVSVLPRQATSFVGTSAK